MIVSSIKSVYTADMDILKFCFSFFFLLHSSTVGEDTGERKCSYAGFVSISDSNTGADTGSMKFVIFLFSVIKYELLSFYALQMRRIK